MNYFIRNKNSNGLTKNFYLLHNQHMNIQVLSRVQISFLDISFLVLKLNFIRILQVSYQNLSQIFLGPDKFVRTKKIFK